MNYTDREYMSFLNEEEWTLAITYLRKGYMVMEAIGAALNELHKDELYPPLRITTPSKAELKAFEEYEALPPYADDVEFIPYTPVAIDIVPAHNYFGNKSSLVVAMESFEGPW